MKTFKEFLTESNIEDMVVGGSKGSWHKNKVNVRVFTNITKPQLQTLCGKCESIRNIKHGNTHYTWNAKEAVHSAVAVRLGIGSKHNPEGSFFYPDAAKEHGYDIRKTHEKENLPAPDGNNIDWFEDLKESLTEALVPKVYRNIRPATLINLSEEHGTTRFVIDREDQLHAGKAFDYTHYGIDPRMDAKVHGAITYNKRTKKHTYIGNDPDFNEPVFHPHLETLEKLGVSRGVRRGDWSTMKVITKKKPLTEGKVHTINGFKVFQNPSKDQTKSLITGLGNRDTVRTLRDKGDHFAWNGFHATHKQVADELGIGVNSSALFYPGNIVKGDFDIPALHQKFTSERAKALGLKEYLTESTNKKVWWHGSASGDLRGGSSGLHLGTRFAAEEALHARIGTPVEGSWDGTREYGKTLLAGKKTIKERGLNNCGFNCSAPEHDYLPHENKWKHTYPNGDAMPDTVKPSIKPYRLKGPMSNTPNNPHEDFKANGYMQANLKKGTAKKGFYYKNDGEDSGSTSIVVPNGNHVEEIK